MAESYQRRWAKLVQSYARLKDLHQRSIKHRQILTDELRDARAEVSELRRELRDRDRASRGSMGKLVATARYTSMRLRAAGDNEAAEKVDDWLDDIDERLVPVVEAGRLITLLEEWCAAMPLTDPDLVGSLYLKTMKELADAGRRTVESDTG